MLHHHFLTKKKFNARKYLISMTAINQGVAGHFSAVQHNCDYQINCYKSYILSPFQHFSYKFVSNDDITHIFPFVLGKCMIGIWWLRNMKFPHFLSVCK